MAKPKSYEVRMRPCSTGEEFWRDGQRFTRDWRPVERLTAAIKDEPSLEYREVCANTEE